MAIPSGVKLGIIAGIGTVLLIISVAWHVMMTTVYVKRIQQNVQISEDKRVFQTWKKTPIPIYTEYYLFNVTNAADIVKNHSKPILQEVGPYVYRQYREKLNITFSENEDVVSYYMKKTYIFDPELSVGNESDIVTMLNVPFAAIANKAKTAKPMEKFGLNFFIGMHKPTPFINKTVGEMLFQGYFDKMVDAIQKTKGEIFIPNATFGLFVNQNGSLGQMYTVNRGRDDNSKYCQLEAYNGSSTVSFWEANSTCSMLNGTDGGQYAPFVNKDERLYLWIPDICRSGYLKYTGDTEYEGVPTYRFTIPPDMLAAPNSSEENRCFCRSETCLGSGVLDLGPCRKGAPIVVSLPHFYNSDPPLNEAVEGLNPNQEDHETYLDIDPITGAAMNVKRKLQVNVKVQKVDGVTIYKNMPEFILPVVWINENARLTPELVEKYKEAVMKPLKMMGLSVYVLYGISALVLLCAIIYAIVLICRRSPTPEKNGEAISVRSMETGLQKNGHEVKPFLYHGPPSKDARC